MLLHSQRIFKKFTRRFLGQRNIFVKSYGKRLLILIFILIICIIWMSDRSEEAYNCYFNKVWTDKKTLQEITNNKLLKVNSKNVFFHETSCIDDGVIKLNSRQACAVESTARMNPDHNIFVLFASQVGFRNKTRLPLIDVLLSYPNVHINYLNLTKYAQGTPLEEWITTNKLFCSKFLVSHTSDVLRYLSLWKYGGTYLDLDIVMLRSLNTMSKLNYAGAESDELVAVGIIHLEGQSGHKIADMCVNDLLENFNGQNWVSNGPMVLTRVLHKICKTKDVYNMTVQDCCENFKVLPTYMCYNLHFFETKKFFRAGYVNETLCRLSSSLIAHVWNKLSVDIPLTKKSDAAYVHIARKYCPKVLEASDKF